MEHLKHGWFAVKNRSAKDIKNGVTIEERHVNEENFFMTYPWSSLPRDRVGIKPLKSFLGKLLYEHIRSEFPALVRDIETKHAESLDELEELGAPRQSASEQRQYLARVVNAYQQAVTKALSGTYSSSLTPDSPLKLRMHVHSANTEFVNRIGSEGHTYQFKNANDAVDPSYSGDSTEDIYQWIRDWYRESRGAELPGTVNPAVVESLFRQQAVKWVDIATSHLRNVEEIVKNFNHALFEETIPDDRIRNNVVTHMEPLISANIKAAEEGLKEILKDEREGTLLTFNKVFETALNAARLSRIIARLEKSGLSGGNLNQRPQVVAGYAHLTIEDQAVYDIHDILKSFYKVAVERFTDNIVVQVIERHLLGSNGPVKCFSVEYVCGLLDTEVADLAGDNLRLRTLRAETTHRIQRLKKAMEIAKKVSDGRNGQSSQASA